MSDSLGCFFTYKSSQLVALPFWGSNVPDYAGVPDLELFAGKCVGSNIACAPHWLFGHGWGVARRTVILALRDLLKIDMVTSTYEGVRRGYVQMGNGLSAARNQTCWASHHYV